MPRVPLDHPATYQDVIDAPEHMVAEIVDGELYTSPRPTPKHARGASSLGVILGAPYDHGRGGPGGWWILDEPELHLAGDVLVPDLAGWRRERMPRLPNEAFFPIAPDWICEVLSPATVALDRARKMRIYAREHVAHAWLVDPIARLVEVYRLENAGWTSLAVHAGAETVRPEPFDAVDLELALLWADEPPRTD